MRTPSIVPEGGDRDVYLVLDDLGRIGRAWRETSEESSGRATLIRELLEGQYVNPVRIVAFNVGEGWSRDVTSDIADELRERCIELDEVPVGLEDFLERTRQAT
ncbi:hypothetical protein [Bradyrhizobium retamae]|uniref:Uncharacterized protein n=1 Tax=Bradyrhizobium retamae TaxID=1300035 RepID=A0A0R3MHN2_9BRAD|nr:hypothetical protein [Bradyrhizobium retamae]KRR19800.1 hypothetical protein CQ13_33105 [Bradyrhizobium retamae]